MIGDSDYLDSRLNELGSIRDVTRRTREQLREAVRVRQSATEQAVRREACESGPIFDEVRDAAL